MVRKKIAVYGWYGQKNLGDEAFKDCFRSLWPNFDFTFFSQIPHNWKDFDALMIGAGSFLEKEIRGLERVDLPLAFVGVGITQAHPSNQPALDRARIVVARNEGPYLHAPDIVFSSPVDPTPRKPERISVMLNNHFCPRPGAADWTAPAWGWFCVEFAQACDRLVEQYECSIDFIPMCTNPHIDDRRAAAYVIDRMKRKNSTVHHGELGLDQIQSLLKSSHLVISQRFHGVVYSTLLNRPFVGISGHDKIKMLVEELKNDSIVNYYGFSIDGFHKAHRVARNTSTFNAYCAEARKKWIDMSGLIETALFG